MEEELHVVQGIIREAEEAATKRERERILALLEHEETRSAKDFFGAHQSEQCVTCINIARIKGETND